MGAGGPRGRREFSHLGVAFRVTSPDALLLRYLNAFLEAYAVGGYVLPPHTAVDVTVQRGSLPAARSEIVVPVHRAPSFPAWNLDAEMHPTESGVLAVWRSRGVCIRMDESRRQVGITVDHDVHPNFAGEAVYVLCRNLSLYLRDGRAGNLLHASGVVVAGKAVVFHGQSMSGKTTLMVHAITRAHAQPLTNDRVYVSTSTPPIAYSWPSFITLCEGTILNHPALLEGAEAYQNGDYPYATLNWTTRLEPVFTKLRKRLYPMHWLSESLKTKYSPGAPLGAMVLPRVHDTPEPASVMRCDLSNASDWQQVLAIMKAQNFDDQEDGLLPWHGLPLPGGAPALENLLTRMRVLGLPIYRLTLRARDLSPLSDLLGEIAESTGGCA
jgi:hypothetical protein